MVQVSKHLSPRKLWKHYFDITISRLHLQEALNRYWSSGQVMTINGVKSSTPSPTSKISFEGKATVFMKYSFKISLAGNNSDTGPPHSLIQTDYLSLSEITFEWGDSYDDKDWDRLRKILAPTLMVRLTDLIEVLPSTKLEY